MTWYSIFLAITIIGIINTIYLTYHLIKGTDVLCLGFPDEWCKKVQRSKYSKTFGIPNPPLGMFMLILVLTLALLYNNGILPIWPLYFVVTFGFLFSLYFLYIQAAVIKAYCTWCVVSALVFTSLFVVQWLI